MISAKVMHDPVDIRRRIDRIPDVFGRGKSAEMAYHETPAGAKTFAAGAPDFRGSALEAPVTTPLENLWTQLSLR
jgi:hypothetical protein